MPTPARLRPIVYSILVLAMLLATATRADVTIRDLSQLKVTPLPFPVLKPGTGVSLALKDIQKRADVLDQTLGSYPPQFKKAEDREGCYAAWSEVLAAAVEVESKQGDAEPVAHVLAELYRQGYNLDVQQCGDRASAILKQGLKKFPDSIALNFEAERFYLGIGNGAEAERALLHLRALRHTTEDIAIERPLLFAYLYESKQSEALKQVDHCMALEPGDPFYPQFKKALSTRPMLQVRVPPGSPNEVTLKGNPNIHFALDRPYQVVEVGPKKEAPKKDIRAYMFLPADGQSAANLTLGSDAHFLTAADIATMHEGAKVAKVKGTFNGAEIEVWRYRDSQHLYSTFWVTATDSAGKTKRVEIDVTANSQQRLEALEKAFSVMDFL